MTSMRENPIRRQPQRRPPWLVAVLIAVAVLVVVGVLYGIFSLIRGDSSEPSSDSPSSGPSPCVTTMSTPADELPSPSQVRVNVFNATGTAGLAGKTAKELGSRNFKVVKVANDPKDKKITGIAEIRFGTKGELSAQVLLFQAPGAELVNDGRKGKNVDLAMGEDFGGLAPVDEVASAMSVETPVVTGIGCASDETPADS
jgi:hypothetical protein